MAESEKARPAENPVDVGTPIEVIADAVKQGVKEAIAEEEKLIDYTELARRLGLGLRATKDLVNCGRITPALRYSNVARFHWPSVLQDLRKQPFR